MPSPNDSVFFMPTPVDGGSKDVMSPREQMAALKPYTKRAGKRPRLLQCKQETVDVGGVSMELITYKPHRHQPDDLMYGRNPELRTILPRGCSFIVLPLSERTEATVIRAFGTRKFGGYKPTDEDERQDQILSGKSSGSSANDEIITIEGRDLSEVTNIVYTEKSNGENMKCGLFVFKDVIYLWAGSKMTVKVWDASVPVDDCRLTDEDHAPYPGETICTMWSKFFLGLSEERRGYIVKLFTSGAVLSFVAEVNRPWCEHMVPISHTFVEFFTTLNSEGISMSVAHSFKIFKSLGLGVKDESSLPAEGYGFYHVPFKAYKCTVDGLDQTVQKISSEIIHKENSPVVSTEGGVLYLCDESGEVVALVKVKNDWYAFWRRVREQSKNVKTSVKSLRASIRHLTFLSTFGENVEKWLVWAELFFTHFRSLDDDAKKYVLRTKYASMVAEFVAKNMANFRLPTREDFEAEISRLTSEKETIQAKTTELQTQKATLSGEEAGKIGKEIGGLRKNVWGLDKKLNDLQTRLLSLVSE